VVGQDSAGLEPPLRWESRVLPSPELPLSELPQVVAVMSAALQIAAVSPVVVDRVLGSGRCWAFVIFLLLTALRVLVTSRLQSV
jgi:hypothetical protein